MTIAAFCRDQLLAHGPLTLDELADRATQAGKTRSLNPRSSVASAIRSRELELADGRWVSPLWLLEGRCLTTPWFGRGKSEIWDADDYDDWYDEPRDTSRHDLALLHRAALLGPLPLAGGGTLLVQGWSPSLSSTTPLPVPGRGELLCFRVVDGFVHVRVIEAGATRSPASDALAQQLDALPENGSWRHDLDLSVSRRLAELVVADPEVLHSPAPPLSTCVPALARAVGQEHQARLEHEYWMSCPSYTLRFDLCTSLDLERLASEARCSTTEWLERQALDAIRHGLAVSRAGVVNLANRRAW